MTKQGHIIVGVKQVATDHYAWPGGYPLFVVLHDGEELCAQCAEENLGLIVAATANPGTDSQWQAEGQAVNWEDESLFCAHCNQSIEVAYPSA